MTVLFLKYVPRKYKLENDRFFTRRSPAHHNRHCTRQGNRYPAHMGLHRYPSSPQAPFLLSTGTPSFSSQEMPPLHRHPSLLSTSTPPPHRARLLSTGHAYSPWDPSSLHRALLLSSLWLCKTPLGMQVFSTRKVTPWSTNFMVFIFLTQIKKKSLNGLFQFNIQ